MLLSHFKSDLSAMRDLRALLADSNTGTPNPRLTDDEVLVGIARLLASGELMLVREGPMQGGAATQATTSSQSDTPPASPPPASSKSQAPENPGLPPNTDGAAQAAVLAAAAASGAPFCSH
jgi:hypothetical protein